MPSQNSIGTDFPIEVAAGGQGNATLAANQVLIGNGTNAIQSVSEGTSGNVLTSQGGVSAPIFSILPTFFQLLSSDPVSPTAGDVWYNTTTHLFKGAIEASVPGTWTIKANLNFEVIQNAGCGSVSSALSFGGRNGANTMQSRTELYNGAGNIWSIKANMNFAVRSHNGTGSSDDGLSFAGDTGVPISNRTERYDGTGNTWTNKANVNTSLTNTGGTGTANDALKFGGQTPMIAESAVTERYDGVGNTWATKANISVARERLSGAGSDGNDVLAFGGRTNFGTVIVAVTERYDGTGNTWTTKSSIAPARCNGGGAGTAGDALSFGGIDSIIGTTLKTQRYDGILNTWTNKTNMNAVARWGFGNDGSSGGSAISFGGDDVGPSSRTEIYDGAGSSTVTFTVTP